MTTIQLAKIRASVVDCLEVCRATDKPFTQLKAYIETLKTDPNWTEDEIVEVRMGVIRELV